MPRVAPDVEAYYARQTEPFAAALAALRARIRLLLPEADEVLSYQVPTFTWGKHVVGLGASARTSSLYVLSNTLKDSLSPADQALFATKSAVHFTPDKPVPQALLETIVTGRLAENRARLKA